MSNDLMEEKERSVIIQPSLYSANDSYAQCTLQTRRAEEALSEVQKMETTKPDAFSGNWFVSACVKNIQEGIKNISFIKSQLDQALYDQKTAEKNNMKSFVGLSVNDIKSEFKDMFGDDLTDEAAQSILDNLRKEASNYNPDFEDNSTISPYTPSLWQTAMASADALVTAGGIGFGNAFLNTGAGIVTLVGKITGKTTEIFDKELAQTVYANSGAIVENMYSFSEEPYNDISSQNRSYMELNAVGLLKEDAEGPSIISDATEFYTYVNLTGIIGGKYGMATSRFLRELGKNTAERQNEGNDFNSASNYGTIVAGAEAAQMLVRGQLMNKALNPTQKVGRIIGNTMINATDPLVNAIADDLTTDKSFIESLKGQGGIDAVWNSIREGAKVSMMMEMTGAETKARTKLLSSTQKELESIKEFLPVMLRDLGLQK